MRNAKTRIYKHKSHICKWERMTDIDNEQQLRDEIKAIKEAIAYIETKEELHYCSIDEEQVKFRINHINPRYQCYVGIESDFLVEHLERLESDLADLLEESDSEW